MVMAGTVDNTGGRQRDSTVVADLRSKAAAARLGGCAGVRAGWNVVEGVERHVARDEKSAWAI